MNRKPSRIDPHKQIDDDKRVIYQAMLDIEFAIPFIRDIYPIRAEHMVKNLRNLGVIHDRL